MRNNLWLTGIGCFTTLFFGFLALFNFVAYGYRRDFYYLAGIVVFGAIAALSVYAVINGWRNALPGQSRRHDEEEGPSTGRPGEGEGEGLERARERVGPANDRG